MTTDTAIRFPLGQTVMTIGVSTLYERGKIDPAQLLARHQSGDWGNVDAEDARENERSVINGWRILSSYDVNGTTVWIITEADRSSTCVLLPEEY